MPDHKEKNEPWLSVPQFGDWDQKGQVPDYSLDFSKIREMRKQNKRDVSRASLGNEEELISSTISTNQPSKVDNVYHDYNQDHSPTKHKTWVSVPQFEIEAKIIVSATSSKPSKARPTGGLSSVSKSKPSQARPGDGVSSEPKSKSNNPKVEVSSALKNQPTNAKPKGGVSSASKGKRSQKKPTDGLSSALKSKTTNPKPADARPRVGVSSKSTNKSSTTIFPQRSSSSIFTFNCCTKA